MFQSDMPRFDRQDRIWSFFFAILKVIRLTSSTDEFLKRAASVNFIGIDKRPTTFATGRRTPRTITMLHV